MFSLHASPADIALRGKLGTSLYDLIIKWSKFLSDLRIAGIAGKALLIFQKALLVDGGDAVLIFPESQIYDNSLQSGRDRSQRVRWDLFISKTIALIEGWEVEAYLWYSERKVDEFFRLIPCSRNVIFGK